MATTNLERRKIGALEVSLIGLGCNNFGWRIDAEESARVVETALDCGINLFDTADMYDKGRSEEYLGRARRLFGRRPGARRSREWSEFRTVGTPRCRPL